MEENDFKLTDRNKNRIAQLLGVDPSNYDISCKVGHEVETYRGGRFTDYIYHSGLTVTLLNASEERTVAWGSLDRQESFYQGQRIEHAFGDNQKLICTSSLNYDDAHPWTLQKTDCRLEMAGIAIDLMAKPYEVWNNFNIDRSLSLSFDGMPVDVVSQLKGKLRDTVPDTWTRPANWILQTSAIAQIVMAQAGRCRAYRHADRPRQIKPQLYTRESKLQAA